MRVSKHFKVEEFTRSQTAARMGRAINIYPGSDEAQNLERLCYLILEPVRAYLGVPIMISSGYRPLWLNQAIGGSKTSDHLTASAADFIPVGMSNERAFHRLKDSPIPYNQLIYEFGKWIHISLPPALTEPSREALLAAKINGRTHYRRI